MSWSEFGAGTLRVCLVGWSGVPNSSAGAGLGSEGRRGGPLCNVPLIEMFLRVREICGRENRWGDSQLPYSR